ncbi:hypothetical protein F5883DRAFT_180479 [Diaporthe sp. PMI_573]|nr:hypothetical protein F5883DRAFT_180479 [Diaporthaceae sp. PMI_573]
MAALETTPTQTNPDHPIRPAALVCRSDEICRSVGLRFEDGLSDGLSDGRSVSHTVHWQYVAHNAVRSPRRIGGKLAPRDTRANPEPTCQSTSSQSHSSPIAWFGHRHKEKGRRSSGRPL